MNKNAPMVVSPRALLAVYGVLPLALVAVAADLALYQGRLAARLPTDPNSFVLFTILFTLPHILASFFGFFDKDYIKTYGKRLLRGAQIATLALIILPLISINLAFYVFAIFTMIHVLFQQGGIAKSLMRGSNKWHQYWLWFGAAVSSFLYLDVYSGFSLSSDLAASIFGLLIIVFSFLGFKAANASTTTIGSKYFWSTHATVIGAVFFFIVGYPILAIAIPRVVHDITAYMYYIAHDHNRFQSSSSNLLYRAVGAIGLPVVVASPLISLSLAGLLQSSVVGPFVLPLVSVLILLHYHTENYIWKQGGLHRQYIKYSV